MGEEIIQELSIREIGEKYKISRMMLQRYERIGLIHSTNRDKYGHLYYNKEMINRILFIRFLQDCYFTLPEINELMHLSIAEIKEALIHQIKELDKHKKVLEKRQETAKRIVNELNEAKINIDEINMDNFMYEEKSHEM